MKGVWAIPLLMLLSGCVADDPAAVVDQIVGDCPDPPDKCRVYLEQLLGQKGAPLPVARSGGLEASAIMFLSPEVNRAYLKVTGTEPATFTVWLTGEGEPRGDPAPRHVSETGWTRYIALPFEYSGDASQVNLMFTLAPEDSEAVTKEVANPY